jgi:predicted nucleic acid-binding protein
VRAAANSGRAVVVPAAVLAEQYRGGRHDAPVDSCLRRYDGIRVVDTTRPLARAVGNLLARAGLASEHHVDATVVAAAIAYGGGVILTSDVDDLKKIAAGNINVVVEPV